MTGWDDDYEPGYGDWSNGNRRPAGHPLHPYGGPDGPPGDPDDDYLRDREACARAGVNSEPSVRRPS